MGPETLTQTPTNGTTHGDDKPSPYHSVVKWMDARQVIELAHGDFARKVAKAREDLDRTLERADNLIAEAKAELSVLVPFPEQTVTVRHGPNWSMQLVTIGRTCSGEIYLSTRELQDLLTLAWPGQESEGEVAE